MIRDARPADLETLIEFNAAMARETEGLDLERGTLREGVAAVLRDRAKGRYFVADQEGAVVGALLITYEWSDWRNAMFWWLQSVYVLPAHRKRGVFAALYRHVVQLASTEGVCGLRLYVHEHNEWARAVYEKLGMEESGYHMLETPDPVRR